MYYKMTILQEVCTDINNDVFLFPECLSVGGVSPSGSSGPGSPHSSAPEASSTTSDSGMVTDLTMKRPLDLQCN